MKSHLRVNGWFIGRSKAYVMVIALNVYFTACGTAIAEPSAVEEPALPARHEKAELGDSRLQRGERAPKDWIDSHAITRPVAGVRVQAVESAKNGRTVSGASSGTTRFEVVSPNEMGTNSSSKQRAGNGNDVFGYKVYEFFHGALFAVLFAWPIILLGNAGPYGGMKPNY